MSAQDIALITDSTCDIPADLAAQHQLMIVPHTIVWGNEQYLDRVELRPEEFYQRVRSGKVIPTTAQATAQQFLAAFNEAAAIGYKEICVITLSNRLSGAVQSALEAAKQVTVPVKVIDSLSVTMGLGWQVLGAARVRDLGGTLEEISTTVEEIRSKLGVYVYIDTIEYLKRGGRIGDAARLLGMMLNIKPIVRVNPQRGLVEEVGISRTSAKAVDMMYEKFFETIGGTRSLHLAVLHGDSREDADVLLNRVLKEFSPVEVLVNCTGPVLGVNTGPGALSLAGYSDN